MRAPGMDLGWSEWNNTREGEDGIAKRDWICWLKHKWTKWSLPVKYKGKTFHIQKRECVRCGKLERRFVL